MQHTQFLLHKRHLSEHLTKIVSAATKVNPLSGPRKRFNATRLSYECTYVPAYLRHPHNHS